MSNFESHPPDTWPRNGNAESENRILLTLLHVGKGFTKTELVKATGLSHPTVRKALAHLQNSGDVDESGSRWSAKRNTFHVIGISIKTYVAVRPNKAGFDITWQMSGMVTDRAGDDAGIEHIEGKRQRDTNTEYKHVLNRVCTVVENLKAQAEESGKRIGAVGVEMGGHVDARYGFVRYSPSFNWFNQPFAGDIATSVGLPTVVENDANAFALFETHNPDRPTRFAVVLLSEGIGGAIVDKRRLLHGTTGGAGEIGHIPVAGGKSVCQCGHIGCVQSIASYPAIRAAAVEAGCKEASVEWIVREADLGSEIPRKILDDAALALSYGIAAIECMIEPKEIIISTTALEKSVYFTGQLTKHVRDHRFRSFDIDIKFISTHLRNAMKGAAWAAIMRDPIGGVSRQRSDSKSHQRVRALVGARS